MVIKVDGSPLLFRDIILLVLDKLQALNRVLLPPLHHFLFSPFLCPAFHLPGFPCFGILFLLFPVVTFILLRRVLACQSLFLKGRFLFLGFLWPGFPLSVFLLFSEFMYYLLSNPPGCFIMSGLLLGSGFGRSFLLIRLLFLPIRLVRIGIIFRGRNVLSFLILGFPGPAAAGRRWP